MSTTENVDIEVPGVKLIPGKRNSQYSSAPILFRPGTSMQKNVATSNLFQLNLSINLCNILSMPVEKETRIQTQVLSRKQ